MNRREFPRTVSMGLSAAVYQAGAQTTRPLHIGHTSITWINFGGGGRGRGPASPAPQAATPPVAGIQGAAPVGTAGGLRVDPEQVESIIRDIADLGFRGVEQFSNAVTGMEDHGAMGAVLARRHDLPLISIVASHNGGDPSKLRESIDLMIKQGKAAKKYGCRIVLMNASGGRPDESCNFAEQKSNIAHALNEAVRR